MSRNLRFVLLIAILVCQKPQAQLTAKEYSIPSQVQQISSVQDTPKRIKALSIGDHVPDFQLNLLNYSSSVTNLSSFNGKLIILDFWASWCYSCLHAIPKLNKLQKEFGDKFQLIFVNSTETTGDNKEKVIQTIKKFTPEGPASFLISYEDSIALKLFPHIYLPHYVWITRSGIVKAITDADDLKSENIKAIIENENVELFLPVKMDYFPDKLMDLGLENSQPVIDENLEYYSVFKKGKIDGLSRINNRREVPDKGGVGHVLRGISLRNVTPSELFETATKYSKIEVNGDFRKRLILELKDPSNFIFDSSKITKNAWEKNNLYTYDLVIPENEIHNIDEYIWRDLNKYSGYTAQIESRNLHCYLLEATDKAKTDPSKVGKGASINFKDGLYHIENASIELLSGILDKNPQFKIPVITKTTKDIKFDFSFDYEHLDISKLRQQLGLLGVELKESVRPINVLVISEKKLKK
jgi:thiol-disulfide isomerase/thioredoxin